MKILGVIKGEGFDCPITLRPDGSIHFVADADIDADGANGQFGAKAAYRSDNGGSEHLANGGMGIRNGKVIFTTSWGPDIAVVGPDGDPLVKSGIVITKTAYRFKGKKFDDPAAYVDSETVPYVVVPPFVIRAVAPIVMGCQAYATFNGKTVAAVVADIGPRTKIGEVSIALARELGIPSSPRTGGTNKPEVKYSILPGQKATVKGVTYNLQPT